MDGARRRAARCCCAPRPARAVAAADGGASRHRWALTPGINQTPRATALGHGISALAPHIISVLDGDEKKRIVTFAPTGAREKKMSANWKAVKEDLEWSLIQGADVKGRAELKDAFGKGDAKYTVDVVSAYRMGQRDDHKLSNLSRCIHEDDKRLYNIGRKLIGLKAS